MLLTVQTMTYLLLRQPDLKFGMQAPARGMARRRGRLGVMVRVVMEETN